MSKYVITAEVDQTWFEILGQITQHQKGFVWGEVIPEEAECGERMSECDVCEAPDGTPHCDCGQCDCGKGE
jgi:hypothetical protein